MAPDTFTLRELPDGTATDKLSLDRIEMRLGNRLAGVTSGPWEVRIDTAEPRSNARMLGVLVRVDDAFRKNDAERIVVKPDAGPAFAVKRHVAALPVPDGPGTKAIDRIHAALHAKFDDEFLVRDMGICASKPGEHGFCNALDAGTDPGASVTVVRNRLEVMATFLREQGLLNDADPTKGLPVNGVIFLDKFWRTGMGRTWAPYDGVFHAIHIHTSGKPNFSGAGRI